MPKNCKIVQVFASENELTNRFINFNLVIDFFGRTRVFLQVIENIQEK